MKNQMEPTDFSFFYRTEEYNKLYDFFDNHNLKNYEVQLLISLFGFNNKSKIDMHTHDGSNKRDISRTVFNKATIDMERNFGLITIVDNYQKSYTDILNNKAFAKNNTGGKYFELPNVSTFYEYFLGGIKPLMDVVSEYGNQEKDIFDAIYEYINDNDDLINRVADEVRTVEL